MSDSRPLNPPDVIACGAPSSIRLCALCIEAYRHGIAPGESACEARARGELSPAFIHPSADAHVWGPDATDVAQEHPDLLTSESLSRDHVRKLEAGECNLAACLLLDSDHRAEDPDDVTGSCIVCGYGVAMPDDTSSLRHYTLATVTEVHAWFRVRSAEPSR